MKRKKFRRRLSRLKFEEKILQITRVTKAVKGGKKLTFRAIVIVGDNRRKVGLGVGRGGDVSLAIDKAIINGKKKLIHAPLTKKYSIPYAVQTTFGACNILLKPAGLGTGVIAGGSTRTVLELAGIRNILTKQFGSNNLLNNAKATLIALNSLNEKIKLSTFQSARKYFFHKKIMQNYIQKK